jgi:hypothetical protein
MDLLTMMSNNAAANFGWLIGSLSGLVFDVAIVAAIALTPRLREHGGGPVPPGFAERWLGLISALLIFILWAAGACYVGLAQLPWYALNITGAAATMTGLLMLVVFPLAAAQIARRSVW